MTQDGYYAAPGQPGRFLIEYGGSYKKEAIYEDEEGTIHVVKQDSFDRWLRKFSAKVCACDPRFRGEHARGRECNTARNFIHGVCSCRCHRYVKGVLHLTVRDNDFTEYVRRAAADFMQEVREGNPHMFPKALLDLEGLRDAFVIGTYGHAICRHAREYRLLYGRRGLIRKMPMREFMKEKDTEHTLNYIDKHMQLNVLPTTAPIPDWNNGEDVYLDINTYTMHIR